MRMYRARAQGGQVAVLRPIGHNPRWKDPWCPDTFDGRGVVFNDGVV